MPNISVIAVFMEFSSGKISWTQLAKEAPTAASLPTGKDAGEHPLYSEDVTEPRQCFLPESFFQRRKLAIDGTPLTNACTVEGLAHLLAAGGANSPLSFVERETGWLKAKTDI
ncbi:hypothetical protein, partial [Henriciella sp.]|uniref:hypothetical protein n=1 Tax=Henriciella sp. TaxID=1968823 RepID=UPI0025BDAA9E